MNAERAMVALQCSGFGYVGPGARDFGFPGRVVQLGCPPARVGMVTSVDGVDREQAGRNKEMGAYGDLSVPRIGRAGLIANKRTRGRLKDVADPGASEPE